MKYCFPLFLFMIGFIQSGLAQGANPSAPFVSPQAKQIYLLTHRNLPIEWYEVVYFTNDPNGGGPITPAYVDLNTMTAYRWSGIVLQPDQIPNYVYKNSGIPLHAIFPHDPTTSDLRFEDIDPPVFYMLLPDGKYAAGYYDYRHSIYYRWGNLEFDKSQLPADAASKNHILPIHVARSSMIPPPPQYAPNSSGAATPTNPNGQTSSPNQTASRVSSQIEPSAQMPKPIAEAAPANDTGIPWWIYAIVVFSLGLIGALWYFLRSPK